MEGKGNFFSIVLLIIVAFLTLTLAALAGFVFIGGGSSSHNASSVSQTVEVKIPLDTDLGTYELYTDKTLFSLKNNDSANSTMSAIQVSMELKFRLKPEYSSIKIPEEKIKLYDAEIKQLVGTFFLKMTKTEAYQLDAKEKANTELVKEINALLNENEKKPAPIIYKIVFSYWMPI